MPKAAKAKVGQSRKLVHPNSRKACQLAKKHRHEEGNKKRSHEKITKLELLGNKLSWFHDNLEGDKDEYSKEDVADFIERYLHRFDEELEQIDIINSIPGRQGRQHFSREQTIKTTLENERRDFETVGLEIPDILNRKNLQTFRDWNSELRYIQTIKMRRFSKEKLLNYSENKTESKSQDGVGKCNPVAQSNEDRSVSGKDDGEYAENANELSELVTMELEAH